MTHTKLLWKCRGPFADNRACEYYEIYNEDGETDDEDSEFIVKAVNNHYELLAALKYARRFLTPEDVDTFYLDEAIKKAEQ